MATRGSIPYGPNRQPWRETLSEMAISAADGKLLVSPPSADPLARDSVVPDGITAASYQVLSKGLTREEQDTLGGNEESTKQRLFQSSMTSEMVNNGGDPFGGVPLYIRCRWVERNVLDYFASLWNAKWPHDPTDPDSYWGYVLTMGSTEGNMHAMWNARNYLSGKYVQILKSKDRELGTVNTTFNVVKGILPTANPNSMTPVLIFSQNSNFSLSKVSDIVNLLPFNVVGEDKYPNENPLGGEWVEGVPCTGGDAGPGAIDIDALEQLVDFFSGKGHPIVVIFNYGSTLKGACDDIHSAGERLVKILKKNNMYERVIIDLDNPAVSVTRKGFWFHVDGALSAAYMPFLEMAYKNGLTDVKPASMFDFRLDYISSVVTSGHKYIGTPWPCGIYIMRNGMRLPAQRSISCSMEGAFDTTIALSRNGHSPLLLWSFISANSYEAQVKSILQCLTVVSYAVTKLRELKKRIGLDLWIMNFPPSLSILFRRPNSRIILKYTLTVCSLNIDSEERKFAQIFIMKHITTDSVDSLLEDLQAPDAFIN